MDASLVAPCGMNCAVCASYLSRLYGFKEKGIRFPACAGCRIRNKKCAFLKKRCSLLMKGAVQFCHECPRFPCQHLLTLDERYRDRYHMSMVENLRFIKAHGIDRFLRSEHEKWSCPHCGGTICCHNGLCFSCEQERLRHLKERYRWIG
jgi:hypothetical protein